MSFFYCIATLLEFAGVHYFTKVGSGEIPVDEEEWEDCNESEEELIGATMSEIVAHENSAAQVISRRRSSLICPIYNVSVIILVFFNYFSQKIENISYWESTKYEQTRD